MSALSSFDTLQRFRCRPNWAIPTLAASTKFIIFVTALLILLAFGIYQTADTISYPVPFLYDVEVIPAAPEELATNSTLGFQKVLALSTGPSWRTRGLEAAANLTGLDISIPPQPNNPDELVQAFEKIGSDEENATTPKHGTAKAWMAHLDLLKFVIASEYETAFIIEDDVDWDLELKAQMRLAAKNVRAYTNASQDDPAPFGTNWDVVWLGHCGAWVTDDMQAPLIYLDETRIGIDQYSGWSSPYIREKIPEGHRQVQDCIVTVCTFGYGVTRQSAPKVLDLLAKGSGEAYDVMLSTYCSMMLLRCVVVNPQLFNHYEPSTSGDYLSEIHIGDGLGTPDTNQNPAFDHEKGFTGNIANSTRCEALFHETCVRPASDI